MLGEKLTQIVLAGAEVQIADKNVFHEMLRVGELFEWSVQQLERGCVSVGGAIISNARRV